jgi:hypothetical protein
MARKTFLAAALVVGLLVLSAGPAMAWDLVNSRTGFGRVTVRGWTNRYNQVAFVANHPGSRVNVRITTRCNSGASYNQTFVDGGGRFRKVTYRWGDEGRCNHTFHLTNRSGDRVEAFIYARG